MRPQSRCRAPAARLLQVDDRNVGQGVRHIGGVGPRAGLPDGQRSLVKRQRGGDVAPLQTQRNREESGILGLMRGSGASWRGSRAAAVCGSGRESW